MAGWDVVWFLSYEAITTYGWCNSFSVFGQPSNLSFKSPQQRDEIQPNFTHIISYIIPYMSASKKAIIVTSKRCGMSDREIAAKENVDPSTVSHIVRRYGKTLNFDSITPKRGCPRKMDERDVRKAHWMIDSGAARNATDLKHQYFPDVGETVWTTLRNCYGTMCELLLYSYDSR